MTAKRVAAPRPMTPLATALADALCWTVFYLQRADGEEVDPQIAHGLIEIIGARLRTLPVADRLAFLQYAAEQADASRVRDYGEALLEIAETLGLE